MMHIAQSGIFALGTGSHSYLECDLLEHTEQLTLVQAIANLREPRTTTGGKEMFSMGLCLHNPSSFSLYDLLLDWW